MAYACYPDVTIIRPSIMFDDANARNTTALVNKLSSAFKLSPVIPAPSFSGKIAVSLFFYIFNQILACSCSRRSTRYL